MRLFFATFVLGIVLTLLGAYFYPLPDAPRFRSEASALANGGREEIFFIRLPGDRLGNPYGTAVAPFPTPSFARDSEDRILAELFRVRDGEGRVIGLASKMSGSVAISTQRARENTDWMVLIPSRGALLASTEGRPTNTDHDYEPDRMGLGIINSGLIIHGTQDFAGLAGYYSEETSVDKVDETGQVHGAVTLRFRMQAEAQ